LAGYLRQFRRSTTQLIIRGAIRATGALSLNSQIASVKRLVALERLVPALRCRVREHMCLALGDQVSVGAERRYFQHVGWYLANALATYHRGLAATPAVNEVIFDDTLKVMDDAFAEGRGVVLTSPHWVGHELAAAVIARRHPMVMLVRQAPTAERTARKEKWYRALGAETVLRPAHAPALDDAMAYLRALRNRKVLAITPDLLADSDHGIEATIFGRPARINGGAFVLAMGARAPMIRVSCVWQPDKRALVTCERVLLPHFGDREAAVRAGVQEWCVWFEDKLRAHPENWLFWLDRRWGRFLRETPRSAQSK